MLTKQRPPKIHILKSLENEVVSSFSEKIIGLRSSENEGKQEFMIFIQMLTKQKTPKKFFWKVWKTKIYSVFWKKESAHGALRTKHSKLIEKILQRRAKN